MNDRKILFVVMLIIFLIILILVYFFLGTSDTNKIDKSSMNIYNKSYSYDVSDIKKYENIIFLGDSITDWYPIEEIYGDLPIINSGVAGYETTDILLNLDKMVYRYNPTKVFILIGTNDLKYDDDKENEIKIVKNIEKIIKNIRLNRSNAKIYVQSIYPVNKEIKNNATEDRNNEEIQFVNNRIKKYCLKNNITYIDIYKELVDEKGNFSESYTRDGLHPTDLGYAKITMELLKYIY